MDTKTQLKNRIKEAVSTKVELTKKRRAYKLASRGNVDEGERRSEFGRIDSERYTLRVLIRHLLLAYALVRGRSYATQEPVWKREKASAPYIQQLILEATHAPMFDAEAWLTPSVPEPAMAEAAE